MEKILISACFLNERTVKYDGGHNHLDSEIIQGWLEEGRLVVVCPESDGGLPTPRPPAEIIKGDGTNVLNGSSKIVNIEGLDVTCEFLRGAKVALEYAKQNRIKYALLKAKSPSCGNELIYDGTFSGTIKNGRGLTAALLVSNAIEVFNEDQIDLLANIVS
jgi:uncharacterized protein YbbK (DUF523 family)